MAKTYNELYLAMRRALKEAGVEEYALEARRLLAQGAGYTDAQLIARMYMYAGDEAEKAAEKLLQRRLSGEPLAYIAGKWEFFGLEMIVTPAVLIPRMDTEPLVFTALEILKMFSNRGSSISAAAAGASAARWASISRRRASFLPI